MAVRRIVAYAGGGDVAASREFYPLTDEPWGVRRFFVADPGGTIVNVLAHHRARP